MRKNWTPEQKRGTQFGGVQQQNTLQPTDSVRRMEPHEKARLMKITGQATDPAAEAKQEYFEGNAPK